MASLPLEQFQPRERAWSNILAPLRKSFINLETSNYIKQEEQLRTLDAQIGKHLHFQSNPLNALNHSPPGPGTALGSSTRARRNPIPSFNHSSILSYYDKHNANRFHWQERFAYSSNRLTFSSCECGRVNSSPPGRAYGISGPWAGRTLSFKRLLTHQTEDMPTAAQTE